MGSKLASERDALHLHIQFLYFAIFVSLSLAAAMWYGWYSAPNNLRISIPPDLRKGAVVRPGEFSSLTVEAFAASIFRELHRWEVDGESDYGKKILENQAYLTPRYRNWLIEDMNQRDKDGELKQRVRWTLEVDGSAYNPENVVAYDDGSWLVNLRLQIFEEVGGIKAKDIKVLYPLRIVKMNVSPAKNHWGLALDGYPIGMQEELIEEVINDDADAT